MSEHLYEQTINIAATPEDVWRVLVDVEAWPTWTASMSSVQLQTPGPLRLGSVAKVRQPRLAPATFTVTGYEDGRSFAWSTGNRLLATVGDHRVEPAPDGSYVTLTLRQVGPLAGVVGALYRGLINRYIRMEAEGLKRESESRG
jgi:carbon monoxide dehydrogenase subunit G